MKKVFMIFLFFFLTGCTNSDNIRFMHEYERDNDTLYNVNISENNYIKYISEDKLEKLLESGSGVIYVGNELDNDCRQIIEPLFEAVDTTSLDTVYYYKTMNLDFISKYVSTPQVPIVLFVYNGDMSYIMGNNDTNELYNDYLDEIHRVLNDVCDEECND